jgi:glucose dehydrogenase
MEGGGGYGMAEDSWGGTFQYPGNAGGFNWGSVAVDADNGLLIGAPMLMGNRIVLRSLEARAADTEREKKRRADRDAARGQPAAAAAAPGGPASAPAAPVATGGRQEQVFDQNRVLYRGDTRPFMSAWRLPLPFFNAATELPCFEPPFAQIGAMDLNTGKLLWKRPVGSMKDVGPFGLPTGMPFLVGTPVQAGLMATRGGLTFHGAAMDSTFRAFDTADWRGSLGNPVARQRASHADELSRQEWETVCCNYRSQPWLAQCIYIRRRGSNAETDRRQGRLGDCICAAGCAGQLSQAAAKEKTQGIDPDVWPCPENKLRLVRDQLLVQRNCTYLV